MPSVRLGRFVSSSSGVMVGVANVSSLLLEDFGGEWITLPWDAILEVIWRPEQ